MEKIQTVQDRYRMHYLAIGRVYPSALAMKMFLSKNPALNLVDQDFQNKKILDIGFGDGRDLVLFNQLGFETYGVEPDREVVSHTSLKLKKWGMKVDARVGFNDDTGFNSNFFDYVYSSSALMYLRDENIKLSQVLRHVYDILAESGLFLGTFTSIGSHVTSRSKKIDYNRRRLQDPVFRIRNGQIYHIHHSKKEVKNDLLCAGFRDVEVFNYKVDWFGTTEKHFMFVAKKQAPTCLTTNSYS